MWQDKMWQVFCCVKGIVLKDYYIIFSLPCSFQAYPWKEFNIFAKI